MNDSFHYETKAVRVVFGAGTAFNLAAELAAAGLNRPLIITTEGRRTLAAAIAQSLSGFASVTFDGARPHVPRPAVEAALDSARSAHSDVCIAIGGGTAIGLAKAMAIETGIAIVAVPTTYSGSEMTSIWGRTVDGTKTTGRDARVAPRIVAYDPLLTLDLPRSTSTASGMNAIAHAVEALYAPDQNPAASLFARDAIRLLAANLRRITRDPRDQAARAAAMLGAHLAGRALDWTAMGLHHRLCHVLGGAFDTPHALTHAVLLPHVVAFNASAPAVPTSVWDTIRDAACGDARGPDAETDGTSDADSQMTDRSPTLRAGMGAALSLHRLNQELGMRASLRDFGLSDHDLDRVADMAGVTEGYRNPTVVTRAGVRALLERAWRGEPPDSLTA